MRITYYGTSASEGWPALFCSCDACQNARKLGGKNIRTRSQALIDESLLLDFPPDTNLHVVNYRLDLRKVQTLLVTHSHHDHFFASDVFMHEFPFSEQAAGSHLDVYGDAYVRALFYLAARDTETQGKTIAFHAVTVFQQFMTADGYQVVPLLADHNQPEKSSIYDISKDGKRVLYAHDTGIFPEVSWNYLNAIHYDLVSLDCTALDRDWTQGHMGFQAVKVTIARLRKQNCIDSHSILVLNHFAHRNGFTHNRIQEEAEKLGCIAAYDGMEIEF